MKEYFSGASIGYGAHGEAEPVLRIAGVTKSFGPVRVLSGISLDLMPGKVLGLVGENGAGKSTLMRCVCGMTACDSGSVYLCGRRIVRSSAGVPSGIHMVPQEFALITGLSVCANIFLGRELRRGMMLDISGMNRRARELLDGIDAFDIDPETPVGDLGIAARQKVEIAKAFLNRASLLIFDEPTTTLGRSETESLFRVIRKHTSMNGSVVYISHKLDEVREICDQIAILRDGVLVEHCDSSQITPSEMISKMVGRPLSRLYPPKHPWKGDISAPPALEAVGVSDGGIVKSASLKLRFGEVVGLAGLSGSGRTEFAETIFGARRMAAGKLMLFGRETHFHSPSDALSSGLAYLPEDRQETTLLQDFSLSDNLTLASLRRRMRGFFIDYIARSAAVKSMISRMGIKCPDTDSSVRLLSGGNQQKAAVAKFLDTEPRIFIFDEPTRGVDVGARAEIYSIIRGLADEGMAVLIISSDLNEVAGICTRVAVMRDGEIAGEAEGGDVCEKRIMELAMGVPPRPAAAKGEIYGV